MSTAAFPSFVRRPSISLYVSMKPVWDADPAIGPIADKLIEEAKSPAVSYYDNPLATSFRSSTDFHFLTGVQWVAHPGNIIDFRDEIARPDDPLVAGIADFGYRSEQYSLHYDPSIEILATTTFTGEHDPVTAGVTMPVVFKRRFGEGRIFYSALGHVPEELSHPAARAFLERGLLWATRRSGSR